MQKRRGHIVAGLPLTESDLHQQQQQSDKIIVGVSSSASSAPISTSRTGKGSNNRFRKRRTHHGSGHDYGCFILGCSTILVLTIVGFIQSRHHVGGPTSDGSSPLGFFGRRRTLREDVVTPIIIGPSGVLPLSQFKILEYPLANAKLVGLYFAASWCPMSTPVTEQLDEFFGDLLLLPPPMPPSSESSGMDDNPPPPPVDGDEKSNLLSIVFVTSDQREERFQQYVRRNWIPVPFDSPERTALKKHFSVCSKPEVERLGIDRKFEIPTLIILDGETHSILTTDGTGDLDEYGDKALDHWIGLHHDSARAMENKYHS